MNDINDPNGNTEPRRVIIPKSGSMNLIADKPYWWVVPSVIFIVLGIVVFILIVNFSDAFRLLAVLAGIVVMLPAEFLFLVGRTGRLCRFETDDEKMTVYRKNGADYFYFSETLGVTFEPFVIWIAFYPYNCGYKVTIHTKLKDIVRYYSFSGVHETAKTPPQDTPFWILVMNMPEEKEKNKEIISGDEYYANETKEKP